MGPNVVIRSSDHSTSQADRPIGDQGHSGNTILIGDDVWLGANVVVVGGVTIGEHSVIGAGAVVTRDLEPYSLAVGVPARRIADRRSNSRGAEGSDA